MAIGDDVPKWHLPVSRTGVPLIWLIIGAALGTFGAQLFSALNLNSDLIRLWTTAMSAALGALGGAVATMYADRRKDRLAFRRKTKSATMRLERVCLQIETLEQQATYFVNHADDLDDAIASSTRKRVMLVGLLLQGLADFGKSPPRFDEILETDLDVNNAMHVEEIFVALSHLAPKSMPGDDPQIPSYEASRVSLITYVRTGQLARLSEYKQTLRGLKAQFEKKLSSAAL